MKILIVDDNQDLASLNKWMLEDEGYEARLARDGREGYSAFLMFKPDLIIPDIQMPEQNGLELMEHVRCHDPGVRTIYMSGNLNQYWSPLEEEKEKYHAGVLEKPFSRDELMNLLSQS
jgi:DNA-binding response OmpR family regulator